MSRGAHPFSAGRVLALLAVGAGAFLLFLYAIAMGWTGDGDSSVTARGDSNALDGYSALVALLERRGHDVSLSSRAYQVRPDEQWREELLVVTPAPDSDPEEFQALIEARLYDGPTLVILPKWMSLQLPDEDAQGRAVPDDWVALDPGYGDGWFEEVEDFAPMTLETGATKGWSGLGLSGKLPASQYIQAVTGQEDETLLPLVTDSEGDVLAGYLDEGGWHPDLAAAGGISYSPEEEDKQDSNIYPLVLVVEPDLMNNYGMADRTRALLAVRLVETVLADTTGGDGSIPIVFDTSNAAMGHGENLLTLAFRPPFLAATLCLLAAMLVVAWRALRRFGPPVAEVPALVHGKAQLARNGAELVQRLRRWHLLGAPYAALVAGRIAAALGLREHDEAAREAAIDKLQQRLAVRAGEPLPLFSHTAQALREARRVPDLLRLAGTLRSIERMLVK